MQRVRYFSSIKVAISRCDLAVAKGISSVNPITHAPAPAPALAEFLPYQPIQLSVGDIKGIRLSFTSFNSSGVVQQPVAPVGPDARREYLFVRCRLPVSVSRKFLTTTCKHAKTSH